MAQNLFRMIPKTDELLALADIKALSAKHSHAVVLDCIRVTLDKLREDIKAGAVTEIDFDK